MKHLNNIKKKIKEIDIDSILLNFLVFLLIVISLMSLVILRDYIGYVGYHGAKGGVITELNIYQSFDATPWNGITGIVIQAPVYNTTWYVYARNAGMSELNPIYPCLQSGITHELYATTLNTSDIDWENVVAGTTALVDAYTGVSGNNPISANKTFTYTMSLNIGEREITDIPTAYMKRYGYPVVSDFPVGILQYNGTIIMVALINDNYLIGYRPDKIFNFEMFVPVPANTTNLRYNLYIDPYDTCPEGVGETGETALPGSIYGWVKDNQTLQPLANAIVAIEKKIYITGADGFYNITGIPSGDYYIIAIKTGFNNYVSNVSIPINLSTQYNISMELFVEPLTGTGPGVGTGVDVGPGQDPAGTQTQTDVGPGIGPGVGPGIGPYIEKPETFGIDHWMSLDKLKKTIRIGNFFTEHLLIFSFRQETAKINIKITGNATQILELGETTASIEKNNYANISIRGFGIANGVYTGILEVSGDFNDTLPIEITVTDEDKLPIEAMLLQLDVLTLRPLPGNKFKFKINLQNLLVQEKYNVKLDYYIRGVESETANNTLYVGNDTVELQTVQSLIKEVLIPPEWQKGEYYLIVEANYLGLYSRTATLFELFEPFQNTKVLGVLELWKILLGLTILAFLIGIILFLRHKSSAQKRFHAKVEYNLLPKKGPRSLYVGKIAETENDTYMDMDKLTVHSIIAGSTGGGKSISAQVIIEECLLKGVAVIVFDPTAQWSGMLRKCADEKMLSFYPRFNMTKKDAKAFSGNIRAIKNPREKLDLIKYWKPGEIEVITTSTLDPKDMDIFVANTVREVFHSNLQEYRGLRFMMVYDEVHRLLPKFGGSGEGFIQIERACREFRKWGIGVMLISQVLADFVGQIKANINTEIQMKTRDEGDLSRIETKYGKSYVQELVKAPVGSGMVQNSDWNRGKPYYITFRPIIHSVVRLTDQELEQYNKYNDIVEDLSYQLEQLEQEGKDVFDLKLELKLSLDKIKSGSFNMVEIYLEGLKPRIEKAWKDLGKTPKKREVATVSEEELKAAISAAKDESAKVKVEAGPSGVAEKKMLGINDDVPPNQMLKLVNGTLVVKLKALIDEIKVLKDAEFAKHVNDDKNDFAVWIREAYGNDKWADIADTVLTKPDYMGFLEAIDTGKEKTFKPLTARTKPYSSKKVEVKPVVSKPAEQNPAEIKQSETKPAEPKPEEKKADIKPVELKEENKEENKEEKKEEARQPEQKSEEKIQSEQKPEPNKEQQKEAQQDTQKGLQQQQVPSQITQSNVQSLQSTQSEKITLLKSAIEKNPTDANTLFSLAAEYHRLNDLINAEIYYKKVLELNHDNPKVLYYLGSIYISQKKYELALEQYNNIIKIQPDYPKVKEYVESINKLLGKPLEVKV